jgi:octaprenyl-diphosphate synthase
MPSSLTQADLDLAPDTLELLASLQRAMTRVEHQFEIALSSPLPPVQKLVVHLANYRGKMLRPQLVALCGLAVDLALSPPTGQSLASDFDARISNDHITLAAVCEMVHMATLVHDDVLDEADVRRKGATVNRLRGNETAVILGDYLFSAAYRLCSTLASQDSALLIATCGMTLCTGELLQLHHRHNASIDQPTYFEIVQRKTGSLIAASCQLGARASGAPPALAERYRAFGMDLGVAFQIQDDLLDLTGKREVVGKPTHRDLELGKLTLPLIHHLEHASPALRARTLDIIDVAQEHPTDQAHAERCLATLAEGLATTGSLNAARDSARTLVERAKVGIADTPSSPAKSVLLLLADQVITRSA